MDLSITLPLSVHLVYWQVQSAKLLSQSTSEWLNLYITVHTEMLI